MKNADPMLDADRLCLESWSVDKLIPSARNARIHSDAQIAEIAGSIRAFGFSNPILVGRMAILSPVTAASPPRASLACPKYRSSF